MRYFLSRVFTPFRLRFYFTVPLFVCVYFWFTAAADSHFVNPLAAKIEFSGEDRGISYMVGPLDQLRDKLSHVHEYHFHFLGVVYNTEYTDAAAPTPFASTTLSREISIHYWLLAFFSTLPLATYFFFTRKHRRAAVRIRRGLCPSCGYDLRAHAPGQNCPECGLSITSRPPPQI